jgi:hypothetical protein
MPFVNFSLTATLFKTQIAMVKTRTLPMQHYFYFHCTAKEPIFADSLLPPPPLTIFEPPSVPPNEILYCTVYSIQYHYY